MRGAKLARHIFLSIFAAMWLAPLYLMFVNAVANTKNYNDNFDWTYKGFEPAANFKAAWEAAELTPGLISNAIYGILGAGFSVALAALAAYSVVALNPKAKQGWFWVIYGVNLVPIPMLLLPMFDLYARSGLYDTRLGLLLIYMGIAIPFAFFLSRNHMLSISKEIVEAAQLDGASKILVFTRIFLPLSWPALGAAFLFQFTWIWNDLLFGLTLTVSSNVRPLMATLSTLVGQYSTLKLPVVLCATIIASLPTAFLYLVGQRLFITGLKAGS